MYSDIDMSDIKMKLQNIIGDIIDIEVDLETLEGIYRMLFENGQINKVIDSLDMEDTFICMGFDANPNESFKYSKEDKKEDVVNSLDIGLQLLIAISEE